MAPLACIPTRPDVEGPFYRADAPWRNDLRGSQDRGEALRVSGTVRDAHGCQPIASAVVDVWQALPPGPNGEGVYDNDSQEYRYRGRMRTDKDGRFDYTTFLPGPYPIRPGGPLRPKHIHYKVTAPDGSTLTTQMYFAGDPYNRQDPFYDPSLEVAPASAQLPDGSRAQAATFDITMLRAIPRERFEVRPAA